MKKPLSLLVLLFVLSSAGVTGQDREVRGRITLFNTYGLNNIEVLAKKAKKTTLTDSLGYFSISCLEKDVIQVQTKGYLAVSLKVGKGADKLDINLVFKDTPKNRKLILSLGHISPENLDYGLKNLKQENNDYCSYPDIYTLIKSKFPEVEVRNVSGGQGIYLRRGNKSLSQDTQMLYIIDGQRISEISFVNPCEIAKIKILTEGGAAKYGAGSSNGALEITTKRAR